ncbi:MAG: DUF4349 domain-containing protein [Deltaproteobacteria bacterium]|nr:DUF4349 domain-containing protein [Deltaproteobacteria bacterium]
MKWIIASFIYVAFTVMCSPIMAQSVETMDEVRKSPEPSKSTSAASMAAGDAEATKNRLTAVKSIMVVKVVNPDEARVSILNHAKKIGGYATHLNDSSITLKLPPEKLNSAIHTFAKEGIVIHKSIESEDLEMEIAQLEGRLTSQMEILKKLRSFFDDSDFAATLDIERSMGQLVNEIENVTGRLRYLREKAAWCVVEVHFRFRQREQVLYVASPFEWLNGANLDAFLEEF